MPLIHMQLCCEVVVLCLKVLVRIFIARKPLLYSYQGSLPSLPVPALQDTMKRVRSDYSSLRLQLLLIRSRLRGVGWDGIVVVCPWYMSDMGGMVWSVDEVSWSMDYGRVSVDVGQSVVDTPAKKIQMDEYYYRLIFGLAEFTRTTKYQLNCSWMCKTCN